MKALVNRLLLRAGLQLRRVSALPLPLLHQCRCDGVTFPFWIGNEHAARWWLGPEVRFDEEMRFLKKTAAAGAVVLEVGAHHGMHTVQLARWAGSSGQVYAFELNANNALVLAANVGMNGLAQVRVHHAAVGDEDGTTTARGERVAPNGAAVPMVSLDGFCRQNAIERVDLVKIDVEGFEARVLRGARELLASAPHLALELHLDDLARYGDSVAAIWAMLSPERYDVSMMVRPDWQHTRRGVSEADLPASGVVNLFLLNRLRRPFTQEIAAR